MNTAHPHSSWPGLPPSLKLRRPSAPALARRSLGVDGTRPSSNKSRGGAEVAETLFHSAFSASPRANLDGVLTLSLRTKGGHDEREEVQT
jgi:hypothetical protein